MIQTTSRLSRGARLRRAKPVWLYAVAVVAFAVLLGVFLMMKH
jgi:hypothetical protein